MKTTKAMRDNWLEIFHLLTPNDVRELCDDIDELASQVARLKELLERAAFSHDSRFDKEFISDLEAFNKGEKK